MLFLYIPMASHKYFYSSHHTIIILSLYTSPPAVKIMLSLYVVAFSDSQKPPAPLVNVISHLRASYHDLTPCETFLVTYIGHD